MIQSHLLHEFEVLDGEVDEPPAVADLLVEGGPLVLHRLQLQPDRLRLRRLREEALGRADEILDLTARVLKKGTWYVITGCRGCIPTETHCGT